MTVLLVDDNEMILMTRRLIFERNGYRVLTASTGAAGLEILEKDAVTVAIVDYHLPDMDGNILCEKIKAQYPHVHIILASGTMPEDISSCPDFVVLKGGSPLELLSKVGSLTKAA